MKQTLDINSIPFDLRPLGLERRGDQTTYYCTPEGAEIIGWAGVDGIHYCTIPKFGEMIFSVNPMDFGDCVHPIARSLEELLRLLLSCVDMSALEQCYAWDEEQFKAFLLDCPATQEQQAVLDAIREVLGLEPIDDAFHYVKHLQAGFDFSQIPYTDDYYDPDMNAAAPERPQPWEVCFDSDFWGRGSGRAGKELAVHAHFVWGDECWYVPAAYVCAKGLVIDFCIEIDPARERDFLERWEGTRLAQGTLTQELRDRCDRENPLNVEFRPLVTVNGKPLRSKSGYAVMWIPADCLPEDVQNSREARRVLTHYALDETKAWSFHRCACLWATMKKPTVRTIGLKLERERTRLEGIHFRDPAVGEQLRFTHPVFGTEHTLTVLEYSRQELTGLHTSHEEYELPTYHTAMRFSLEPELASRNFQVRDCLPNDEPRRRVREDTSAEAIAIIGGADGPTVISLSGAGHDTSHMAYSTLHFKPQKSVEWKLLFYEKLMEDLETTLYPLPEGDLRGCL